MPADRITQAASRTKVQLVTSEMRVCVCQAISAA
jgi:hypothetical protein